MCGKEKRQEEDLILTEGGQSSKCITYIQAGWSNGGECSRRNNLVVTPTNSLVRTDTEIQEMGASGRNSALTEVGRQTDASELLADSDTDCVVPELNQDVTEQYLGTNVSGIINLADAATPSLSHNSDEISNYSDEEDEPSSEDMRMLLEVEELERLELAKQKLKGKRKLFDSEDEADETTYTNGLSMYVVQSSFSEQVQCLS